MFLSLCRQSLRISATFVLVTGQLGTAEKNIKRELHASQGQREALGDRMATWQAPNRFGGRMKLYRDIGNENKNVDPKRVVESFQLRLLSQLRHSRGPCFSKCRGASAARAGSCWQRRQDGGFPGSHRLRPRLSVQEPHHLRLKGNGRVMDSVQLSQM